jgi:hypothetical protein
LHRPDNRRLCVKTRLVRSSRRTARVSIGKCLALFEALGTRQTDKSEQSLTVGETTARLRVQRSPGERLRMMNRVREFTEARRAQKIFRRQVRTMYFKVHVQSEIPPQIPLRLVPEDDGSDSWTKKKNSLFVKR